MTTVAEIADVQLGKMLDRVKNRGTPAAYLRNVNVRWGEFDLSDIREMRFTDREMQFFEIRDGDLIVCEGGEPGRAAVWRQGPTQLKFQKALHRIRTHVGVLPDYLEYYLRHAANAGLLIPLLTGSTIKHLPRTALLRLRVPLAPPGEQHRIVAKLDSLFDRTRRAREELSHIPRLIENYKQVILEAAFGGELTKDWEIVDFSKLIISAQNGLSKRSGTKGKHMKVLRLSDLSDGLFMGDNPRSILLDEKEINKYCLNERDLICIRVNGSEHLVGRMLAWSDREDWAFCDHFIRFKLKDDVADTAFVSWYFATDYVRRRIETTFVSSAGQKTVSQRMLAEIEVPQPDIKTQRETVWRIERAMEWLRFVDLEHAQAVHLLGHLDQANLSKAFRGELVPQDPNDEPASVLLERIRADRAEQTRARRGSRV